MGLGCILCRKPLVNHVTPRRINWALANNESSSFPTFQDQYQQKTAPVSVSTCGHLFHRQCLRTFFASHSKKSQGGYKHCPYCNSQFSLAQCFQIHLQPQHDHTSFEMKLIMEENNGFQQNLTRLKRLLVKRQAQLQEVKKRIEWMEAQDEVGGGGGTEDEIKPNLKKYTNLNQRLVSMIQQSMEMKEGMWRSQAERDAGSIRPYSPQLQSRPIGFRTEFREGPRNQYASYPGMKFLEDPEAYVPPPPPLDLDYSHQLQVTSERGQYKDMRQTTQFPPLQPNNSYTPPNNIVLDYDQYSYLPLHQSPAGNGGGYDVSDAQNRLKLSPDLDMSYYLQPSFPTSYSGDNAETEFQTQRPSFLKEVPMPSLNWAHSKYENMY